MVSVSVVVPVYSGELYLERLTHEIVLLREQLTKEGTPIDIAEVIFVDDAAKDGSAAIIDRLAAEHVWMRAIHLSRNFGQHPATIAGVLYTAGDWIVTMDEDLQHPPARIPEMFAVVARTSADIVYAEAEGQIHQSVARDLTSRTYKAIMEWLTGNRDIRKANSFRLLRGEIARAASSVCGHETYFDIALGWYTDRIQTARMALKDERYIKTRTSGYNFGSLLSHARRLVSSSQIKLLRGGAFLGFLIVGASVLFSSSLILVKLFTGSSIITIRGWTSLMLAVSFFGGMLLLLSGIMLEYISLLVLRAHGKPLFFVIDRSGDQPLIDYFSSR